MKILNTYFCLLLLVVGFAQVDANEESSPIEEYSNMTTTQLDAAFVLAVREGNSEKIEELLQAGANINTPIPYTWSSGDCDWRIESSALLFAVRKNDPNLVRVLLTGNPNLNEAFQEAINEGYSEVVEELIKGGADINYRYANNNTHLILAVTQARATSEFSPQAHSRAISRWSQRRHIIEMLLTAGANVSHVNKYGRTALMEAVMQHDLNTVQKLLEIPEMTASPYFGFGTKPINYADQDGNTALILAIQNVRCSYSNNQEYNICRNSQDIINIFLENPGIDPHLVNKKGQTAIILLEELHKKMNGYL